MPEPVDFPHFWQLLTIILHLLVNKDPQDCQWWEILQALIIVICFHLKPRNGVKMEAALDEQVIDKPLNI